MCRPQNPPASLWGFVVPEAFGPRILHGTVKPIILLWIYIKSSQSIFKLSQYVDSVQGNPDHIGIEKRGSYKIIVKNERTRHILKYRLLVLS